MPTTTSNPTSQVTTTDDGHARDERLHVVRRFFQLLHDKDIDTWATLWHPQGKILVYYPAEGFPPLIEGKDQITAGFQDLIKTFRSFDTEQMQIFPAATSDAVCVQYRPRAVLVDGATYTNDNVAIFRFQDGLIREYHDYFDPRRFQLVVDALLARKS